MVPCGRLVGPKPEGDALMRAANDEYWRTQMLPRIVVAVAGYSVIGLYMIRTVRSRGRGGAR